MQLGREPAFRRHQNGLLVADFAGGNRVGRLRPFRPDALEVARAELSGLALAAWHDRKPERREGPRTLPEVAASDADHLDVHVVGAWRPVGLFPDDDAARRNVDLLAARNRRRRGRRDRRAATGRLWFGRQRRERGARDAERRPAIGVERVAPAVDRIEDVDRRSALALALLPRAAEGVAGKRHRRSS